MEDSSEQQHPVNFDTIPMRWSEPHPYPHSHHGTPAQEYQGFAWGSSPLPMHSAAFPHSPPLRPSHQQLQPLMMPWPSMLGSQQAFYPTLLPQHQVGATSPPTMTPVSAASSARSGPSVRKTLSDDDRRRMCKYAEENPTAKQTEIGYLFGVERSTVSKVLRKKEIYLSQAVPKETTPRSPPPKRSKSRLPDIEKTLSAWVTKEQKKGSPITDDAIREQAYYFASISGPDNHAINPTSNPGWLEKFKLKHHLGAKNSKGQARKDSMAEDGASTTVSSRQSPSNISPISAEDMPTTTTSPLSSNDTTATTDDACSDKRTRKSPPSINTAFTDLATTRTCFTPSILSPTSPFFSPESSVSVPLTSPLDPTHTFPGLGTFFPSSPDCEQGPAQSFLSPSEENGLGLDSIDEAMEDVADHDIKTIDPGTLLPSAGSSRDAHKPTKEEARQALRTVLEFFQSQPSGCLDFQEGVLLGRLVEKLQLGRE